jgi:pyruvate kinase
MNKKNFRRAKIVATLGPSSSSEKQIEELARAGMNVARLNMSHGSLEDHGQTIKRIRDVSKVIKRQIGILMDLQGPKIRVSKIEDNILLKNGDFAFIGTKENLKSSNLPKGSIQIPCGYSDLVNDLFPEARVFFDDGNIKAIAVEQVKNVFKIKLIQGGELKPRKGINLPDCKVTADAFTPEDKKNLMFGLKSGVDFIALSFISNAEDIKKVKVLLHSLKIDIPIIAKVERPQAIDNIDSIIKVTDIVMIARGDMGVEIGNHLVPAVQKMIIKKCNDVGIPVITATQMLESMIESSTPTRAEASDVANAIWDGTDAVMLSGETASGKYPEEAVKMMDSIIYEAERTPRERPLLRNTDLSSVNASTMVAASLIAEKINAVRIVSVTQSGNSCLKLSRFRPVTRVLGVTNDVRTARKMTLYWGVKSWLTTENSNLDGIEKSVINNIKNSLDLKNGDKLVITRGDGRFFSQGQSNTVRVELIKDSPVVRGGSDTLYSADFKNGQINLDTFSCATCFNCVSTCPHDIWQQPENSGVHVMIDESKIDNCSLDMECVNRCPTGAIEIISKGE